MIEINAARAINPIPNGNTRPYYVTCNDGNTYAVKFGQNPEGYRVLVNEFVCAEIAKELELPLAEPAIIIAGKEFISDFGDEISNHIYSTVQEGRHFGSSKVRKATQITSAGMISQARNIHVIPELVIFDQFICNVDRDRNMGNLLFDISKKEIVVIDHTHAFEIGAMWDATQLRMRIGQPFEMFDTNGYVYKKLVQFVDGNNPFHTILTKLSGMTDERLWHIINSVPAQWGVNDEEKHVLHEYLIDRRNRIEQVLPLLRQYLPRWKGGS